MKYPQTATIALLALFSVMAIASLSAAGVRVFSGANGSSEKAAEPVGSTAFPVATEPSDRSAAIGTVKAMRLRVVVTSDWRCEGRKCPQRPEERS